MATKQVNIMLKYALETYMLMVSKDRLNFFSYLNIHFKCAVVTIFGPIIQTAFYQANPNEFCVVALNMQNQHIIKEFCKQMVVLGQKLPLTRHLSYGLWIVVTDVPLTLTINC